MSAKTLLNIGMLMIVLALAMPALGAPTVTRSMPATATAGDTITVALDVMLDNATYYLIDEALPNANWTVVGVSGGGDSTSHAGHVKWACISGCTNATLYYNVTIPVNAVGTYVFSGTYGMEGINETPIGGASSIEVSAIVLPDFTISVSPASASVQVGSNVTATVTVGALAGYNKSVTLTALNVSSGITASFSPASVIPTAAGNTSAMKVSVSASAAVGTYPIVVRGRATDGKEHNATFTLIVAKCGNGVCESGETASNCPSDCQPPSPPPGPPGPPGPTCDPQKVVAPNTANLTIGADCVKENLTITWVINQPTSVPVTSLSFTASKTQAGTQRVNLQFYSTKPAGLLDIGNAVVYKWFYVNSTVADANISSARIFFAVPNAWIVNNSINDSTIALYRFSAGTPNKLSTAMTNKDTSWTYYDAMSPGLSFFAIAGQQLGCPACPQPSEWTSCTAGADGKGTQSRTQYVCSAATQYQCVATTVTQNCCPACPQPGDWSSCVGGKQSRTDWRCSAETGWKCEQYTAEQSCVDAATANAALLSADAAIRSAESAGKNVTLAESLFAQAEAAYDAGAYENSLNLALQAKTAAETAPLLPPPPILEILIVLLAIVAVAAALWYMKRRGVVLPAPKLPWIMWLRDLLRLPPKTVTCVVCGEPTTLHIKCTTCGQYACVRHMQTIAGKPYCTNCVRKMYAAQQQPQQ